MNSRTDNKTPNTGQMQKEYKMQNFLKLLHTAPTQNEIHVNKEAGDSQYLPISLIEMRLDEFFFGHWEVVDFEYGFQGTNLHGQLTLRMLHPISKIWINRVGVAATSLKTDEHQSNELAMALPLLKTECLKNATRSIGKAFARDLNREVEANYTPLLKPKDNQVDSEAFSEFKSIIDVYKNPGRLRDTIKIQLDLLKRKGKNTTTINACKRYASDKYKRIANGALVI